MTDQYYYIAVDLGAESGRVMLASTDTGKIALQEMHRFATRGFTDSDNTLRWNFDRLMGEIYTGIEKTLSVQSDIKSIGVDTWGVDYGLLDGDGKLIENPYHYRDSRTDGMIEYSRTVMPKEDIYNNTGIQTMFFNTLYQLIACKQQRPELLENAKHLLFMPNLIMYYLCGNISAEYTDASTSQLLDMKTGQWSDAIVGAFDLPKSILPEIVQPGTTVGKLKIELAEKWNCSQIPIVAVGTHDTASAVAAVPSDNKTNWAYLSSGTWSCMGLEIPDAIISERTAAIDVTNEGGVENTIRLLKNIIGLWPLQECKRYWADKGDDLDYGQMVKMAIDSKPFAGKLDMDHEPFFTPGKMPEKINEYLKSTGQHEIEDKGQMIRVLLESLADKYNYVLKLLEDVTGENIDIMHIVGGGCQNELLNQLTANAIGKKVITGPVEATVLGNVLVQAMAAGQLKSLQQAREMLSSSFELKQFLPE